MTIKVAFVSPRPFGMYGTPGTYKFVELIGECCSVRVFARPPCELTVHFRPTVPLIPIDKDPDAASIQSMLPAFWDFSPDIVYLFNQADWPGVLDALREALPNAKFILDIKSPLVGVSKQRLREIQRRGQVACQALDGLITHSLPSIDTWIPGCDRSVLECPPGIDGSLFNPDDRKSADRNFRNFVYVASLHPSRQASRLVAGFAKFLQDTAIPARLDIYGDGSDREVLEDQVVQFGVEDSIRFRGLVRQETLMAQLSGYDAGIAWVPRELYDNAPSLKALEYMAAGLPVMATATKAHEKLVGEGFSLDLFTDDADGVAVALKRICEDGFAAERIANNLKGVQKYDYRNLVQERILPLLERLVGTDDDGSSRAKAAGYVVPYQREAGTCELVLGQRAARNTVDATPMRLAFVCYSTRNGVPYGDVAAIDIANEMARQGHCVYLAYSSAAGHRPRVVDEVILLPYEDIDALEYVLANVKLDVLIPCCEQFWALRELAAFGYTHQIPVVVHEGFNALSAPVSADAEERWSRGRLLWERHLVAAAAACIGKMPTNDIHWLPSLLRDQSRTLPIPRAIAESPHVCAGSGTSRRTVVVLIDRTTNPWLHSLLQVFAQIAESYPEWDIRIVANSPEHEGPQELLDVVAEHKIEDRISLFRPDGDIATVWVGAHINVILSIAEGRPGIFVQAMSAGLPVVALNECLAAKCLIRHEINGLLVQGDDRKSALEYNFSRLMADSALRERLASRAAEDVRALTEPFVCDQWLSILREVAAVEGDKGRSFDHQCEGDAERLMSTHRMRQKTLGRREHA